MLIPELKIADRLRLDWSERFPAGTRVIIDKFKVENREIVEADFILYAHVCEPHLDHGRGVWLSEVWFASYKNDPKPRNR